MTLISKTSLLRFGLPMLVFALAGLTPAATRADGFDDMRHFFTTDFPHFFQDDIPCAFGGKPTSGTKTSCHPAPPHKAEPAAKKSDPANPSEANAPTSPPSDVEQKLMPSSPAATPDSH